MISPLKTFISLTLLILLSACQPVNSLPNETTVDDGRVHLTILHFNDVYEITAVSGGKEGGLARVATLRKQLLARNPNTITTLGGDLFSPSAIGTAEYQGDRLAGRQMVDVLNHLGLDYATFGNHEFDVKESQFFKRMDEVKFNWVSSNVFDANGQPFAGVKPSLIIPVTDPVSGASFKLGIFGVTLTVNQPDFVTYTEPMQSAAEQVKALNNEVDFLLALTHQSIDDDETLIQQQPSIDLLLGGHEHVNYQRWRGNFTPLLKGDGNARSVYVVDIYFDPKTGEKSIEPRLVLINESIAEDPEVKAIVDQWVKIAFDAFREQGFEPEAVVTTTTEPLDGRASSVRTGQTNLSQLIARSMLRAYSDVDLTLYNSGSIRIDDILPAGKISEYDVIRVLPFGGAIQLAEIRGDLLEKTLLQGQANAGAGGYLQSANTAFVAGQWQVNGKVIDKSKVYKIAISDFLASGREQGLAFIKPGADGFKIINDGKDHDIRQLVIDEMKSK